MNLFNFIGCKSKQEVEDRYIEKRIEFKKLEDSNKWNNLNLLEEQLRFIEGNKLDYPIKVEGTYYINSNGEKKFRIGKRKYVKKNDFTIFTWIDLTIKSAEKSNYKPISTYYKLIERLEHKEIKILRVHLEYLAEKLGYSSKWVDIKCKELKIE